MDLRRLIVILVLVSGVGCEDQEKKAEEVKSIRVGHFPNVTHAQALVARQLQETQKDWYGGKIPVPVEWYEYKTGASVIESIAAGELDMAYIGPIVALNAYLISDGKEVRVLKGSMKGGSALVTHPDAKIESVADLRGKRIGSPQIGNTQDVMLRDLLDKNQIRVTMTGGDAMVFPIANADHLLLFKQGDLDASWVPEPFATQLEMKVGAKVLLEDKSSDVTLLICGAKFLKQHPEWVEKFVDAEEALTEWMMGHGAEMRKLIKAELKKIQKTEPDEEMLVRALARCQLSQRVRKESLEKMVASAKRIGFIKDSIPLDGLLEKNRREK
jgi:NitT/TauT family transport system substrate-binding protein